MKQGQNLNSRWAVVALIAMVLTSCGSESIETGVRLTTRDGGVFLKNDYGIQDLLEGDGKNPLLGSLSVSEKKITFSFSRRAGNAPGKIVSPENDEGLYIFYPDSSLSMAALRAKLLVLAAAADTKRPVVMAETFQARQSERKGSLNIMALIAASASRSEITREKCKIKESIPFEDSPSIRVGIPGLQSVEYEVRDIALAFHGRFLNEADEILGSFSTPKSLSLPVHMKEISRGPCKIGRL